MAAGKKYYAVARGRNTGVFTAWAGPDGAEAQVRGFPGARYKGFATLADAREWLATDGETPCARPPQRAESSRTCDQPRTSAPDEIEIYTDGGCINNPGPGGYGVVIIDRGRSRELSGGFRRTTNNRMELMACVQGLAAVPETASVVLYSDSRYVVNAVTRGWVHDWRRNNWRRSGGAPVENCDLWEQVLAQCERRKVRFVWLKGHAGTAGNERCDRLARAAALRRHLPADHAYENNETRAPLPPSGRPTP